MKASIKPFRRESKTVLEKINDLLTDEGSNEKIIIANESDLRKLIANIIVEMDANYVRKSDLPGELQKAFQGIVKSNIVSEG